MGARKVETLNMRNAVPFLSHLQRGARCLEHPGPDSPGYNLVSASRLKIQPSLQMTKAVSAGEAGSSAPILSYAIGHRREAALVLVKDPLTRSRPR
jgi:hypothetical protein